MSWIPLHVHSQYSILDSTASISGLVAKAKANAMSAMALTDHGNLFGAIEFYRACKKEQIQPILGSELYIAPRSRFEKKKVPGESTANHLVLLVKNETGYRNLCRLSSLGYKEGFYYHPRIDKELLEKYHEGLICLTACLSCPLASFILKGDEEGFERELQWYHDLFGCDLYLELQRHTMNEERQREGGLHRENWLLQSYQNLMQRGEQVNQALIKAAKNYSIPVVATNDSRYLQPGDWKAHEILLNVQSGEPCEIWENDGSGKPICRIPNPKRRVYPSHEFYFKSPEEMAAIFQDIPQALSNTLEVAEKCSWSMNFEKRHYPVYSIPGLQQTPTDLKQQQALAAQYLRQLCEENIPTRYTEERLGAIAGKFPENDPMEMVKERLAGEMEVIGPKGLSDYLLIVYDFIHWSKQHNIAIGPGRGSGVGSIVLYLLGVTDIEPIRFGLFFERFLNPERLSYPDIDVDICMERRDEVIAYMAEKYGEQSVAQIITFGSMKAKMAIRDVGRVLSIPLAQVNALAKLVPEELNITLERALETSSELYELYVTDRDTKQIIDYARILEGSIRSIGTHAAGIVVCCDPLMNHIPLYFSKDSSMAITQYSMKPVEAVGMLKIDFLGLKTLTAIQKTVQLVEKRYGKKVDIDALALNDEATYQLINQGKTLGIFQLESKGFQDLVCNLHVESFEEIMVVVALYRPGPMEMIPSFIARKKGEEPIEYLHPFLKEILSETYGIMVYQEQVMQIAQRLARFSLSEGDILRQAMGKKIGSLMDQMRDKFLQGCEENEIEQETAKTVFDHMEKFAAYGFNKSHAAAYAMIIYMTAYLKAHYPKEWMAALMTCDCDDTARIAKYMQECREMEIALLPPDINESGTAFTPTDQGVRFALNAIKGVGEGIIERIVKERDRAGAFKTLYQFVQRIHRVNVGKKMIECLVLSGCFDYTKWDRNALLESIEPMQKTAAQEKSDEAVGAVSLFSLLENRSAPFSSPPTAFTCHFDEQTLLLKEKELIGFFLTGHPLEHYRHSALLSSVSLVSLSQVSGLKHNALFRSCCLIESVKVKFSSKVQKKFAIATLSDGEEFFEVLFWANLYEIHHAILQDNRLIYALFQVDQSGAAPRLLCHWLGDLQSLDEANVQECEQMVVDVSQRIKRREKMGSKKQDAKTTQKEEPPVQLSLDVQQVGFEAVYSLKQIFNRHAGGVGVVLHFSIEKAPFAQIDIEPMSGITSSKECLQAIQAIKGIEVLQEESATAG